jgi:hypothetical protein
MKFGFGSEVKIKIVVSLNFIPKNGDFGSGFSKFYSNSLSLSLNGLFVD